MAVLVDAGVVIEGTRPDGEPIMRAGACVVVEGGTIAAIIAREDRERRYPRDPVLGGSGTIVAPGFVNAHHHVGTTPFQLGSPDHPLELWFASRLALRDVDMRLDTLVSAFELIESGVTTVQHLHSRAPGGVDDVVAAGKTIIDAYREIGMRASYSMALRDQNRLVYEADEAFVARLPEALRPAMAAYFARFTLSIADQLAIFRALRALVAEDTMVAVQIAPSNLHWLSDAALDVAAGLSADTGLPMHMHLVETPYQRVYARRRTGGTAFEHVHRMGLTGPKLTVGHGVWMSEADIRLCAETGTRLCHNCSSNFRLKSGVAPLARFVAEGVPIALGMDEAGLNDDRDMLQEIRLVHTVHRAPGIETADLTAGHAFRMATEGGAGTTPFGDRIGRIEPGREADLVVFDRARIEAPWQAAETPVVDLIVKRARPSAIALVMIAGEVVYRDGAFARVDRAATHAALAERFARAPNKAERERVALSRAVMPHVRRFYEGWLEPGDLDFPVR